jgi:hypothetical protein
MVDPYKIAVDLSLPVIKQLLADAVEKNKKQTERCVSYLRAAQTAVQTLHKEFEAIVVQAKLCDLSNKDQVKALERRICIYLDTNDIRDGLWTALAGMRANRSVLQERVDSIFNMLRKDERQRVVAEFVQTTEELEGFVKSLGEGNPSGVGVEILLNLQRCVEQWRPRKRPAPTALREILAESEAAARLKERKELAERTEKTINRLLARF